MCEGDCAYVSLAFESAMSKTRIELEVIYMSVVHNDLKLASRNGDY